MTGGSYYRTYTNDGSGVTGIADPASVSSFCLDKYLVTVGRFRQFVTAWNGGWLPAQGSGKHTHLNGGQGLVNVGTGGGYETGWDATDWNNTTDVDPTTANLTTNCDSTFNTWGGGDDNRPINCVNWWEAYAFCIWDGGFLPSESEWEYVAAGGSQQREYPWGNAAVGTACPGTGCEYAIYQADYPNGSGCCGQVTNIAPVGYASQGAGLWGQLDMAGEVFEWNLDWSAGYASCTDCANLSPAQITRVVRGGYFLGMATPLLPPFRSGDAPTSRFFGLGFRCARTP